jgi:hypothetical protein
MQKPEAGFELGQTWRTILETLLYRPVKAFLEGLGFVVKGRADAACRCFFWV